MRNAPGLTFLLLLPALIALGHDIYLFTVEMTLDQIMSLDFVIQDFKFSSIGYIWTMYEPGSFQMLAQNSEPEQWAMFEKFFAMKAFFLWSGYAIALIALFYVLKFFGFGPYAEHKGDKMANFNKLKKRKAKKLKF